MSQVASQVSGSAPYVDLGVSTVKSCNRQTSATASTRCSKSAPGTSILATDPNLKANFYGFHTDYANQVKGISTADIGSMFCFLKGKRIKPQHEFSETQNCLKCRDFEDIGQWRITLTKEN